MKQNLYIRNLYIFTIEHPLFTLKINRKPYICNTNEVPLSTSQRGLKFKL